MNWTDNAEATLRDQQMETLRVSLTDLEDGGIDWGTFTDTGNVRLHEKKQLRQHQRDAIQCVRDGLAEATAASSSWPAAPAKLSRQSQDRRKAGRAGSGVLFLVPSLALLVGRLA